jgi:hypothetical protein
MLARRLADQVGPANAPYTAIGLSRAPGNDGGAIRQFGACMGGGQCSRGLPTGDYYQGKKSIPRPLQLIRHAGSGPLELIAHEALALTRMDWNNDALYDPVPVSIRYSQKLARTIANVPDLPRNVYPYRLFM